MSNGPAPAIGHRENKMFAMSNANPLQPTMSNCSLLKDSYPQTPKSDQLIVFDSSANKLNKIVSINMETVIAPSSDH